MATRRWAGGASAVAQVQTFAFGGTWEADDYVRATVGTKTYDFVAGSTVTATVVSNLVAAWNLLTLPEFAEVTASANGTTLTLTGDTAGRPFVVTLQPFDAGGAADSQTIAGAGTATTGTAATACSGPNFWSVAANWIEGSVPVTGDDVVIDGGPSVLYGLDQSAVTLATLTIGLNFPAASEVGLPANTSPANPAAGYPEYRAQRLKVGATVVTVETTSRRVRLDLTPASTTVTVRETGQAQVANEDALDLAAAATATVHVLKGQVGVNNQTGDSGTVASLNVSFRANESADAAVRCGAACVVTALNQSGGTVTLQNGAAAIVKSAGTLTLAGGAVTTLTNRGGTVYHDGAGTITTLNNLATFLRRGFRAATVTNTNLYGRSVTSDRNGTLTLTNPAQLVQCRLAAGPDDRGDDVAYVCLGTNRTLTQA